MFLSLEILQTCNFYDTESGDEMRAEPNRFSRYYGISVRQPYTHKTVTGYFVPKLSEECKVL